MIEKKPYIGQIAISTQGRDKGNTYIIVDVPEPKQVLVADGKYKLLTKPKKKRLCHLHLTPQVNAEIAEKLGKKNKVNDQMVYHALHEYSKLNKEATNGK